MSARIDIPKNRIAQFCQRHHIQRMALFGSVLRDDFTPDSDVDVLVEFAPGKTPGLRSSPCRTSCRRYSGSEWTCTPSLESKEAGTGCSGRRY